jgi:hypothetical protein
MMKIRKVAVSTIIALVAAMLMTAGAMVQAQVIYDSTVSPLPGNLPSVGAEAYSFTELGDEVTFAGTSRKLVSVNATLSSWGCQSGTWYKANCVTTPGATFTVPITINIYNTGVSNIVAGSLIATRTQTFSVPYRPSGDSVHCTGGRWYDAGSATCFNGKATNITFDFSSMNITLPNTVVYGIAYNTSHYGPAPIGETAACFTTSGGCPYDSMNIALGPLVNVGSKPFFRTLYQNAVFAGDYCDGQPGGIMRLDSPGNACWYDNDPSSSTFGQSYIPTVKFNAANPALTKDDCKNDGWQTHTTATGAPFKNQGQCIDYVEDKKDNDDRDKKDNDDKDKKDKKDKDDKGDKHDH